MNELFAAEPRAIGNASDLRLLLSHFGPYAGRYLALYPTSWLKEIMRVTDEWSDLERSRALVALRKAKESAAVIVNHALAWSEACSWIENASSLANAQPKKLDGVVVRTIPSAPRPPYTTPLDELQLPPTSDELISATPDEYARVCRTLVHISPELILVDPYLDLCSDHVSSVIERLLQVAAEGKALRLKMWARKKAVVRPEQKKTLDEIRKSLDRLVNNAPVRKGFSVELRLVDDDASRDRLHARYLISIKGGVRFDQGFQKLPRNRRVEVGPVGEATHNDLLSLYADDKNDLKTEHRLTKQKS